HHFSHCHRTFLLPCFFSLGANVRPIQPLIEPASPHTKLTVPIQRTRTYRCTRSATRAAPARDRRASLFETVPVRPRRSPLCGNRLHGRGNKSPDRTPCWSPLARMSLDLRGGEEPSG